MSKVLCIYPKDESTAFLQPLFDAICAKYNADGLIGDPIVDDNYFEKLEQLAPQADVIFFFGHGCSHTLYGINLNPIICKENDNVHLLEHKTLILYACRSVEFIETYNLSPAWGFGFIPTSLDDARGGELHHLEIKKLEKIDIEYFQDALIRIWLKTLEEVDVLDVRNIYHTFSYNTNVEIVNCLTEHQKLPHFRIIADMLYYLKEDMDYIE